MRKFPKLLAVIITLCAIGFSSFYVHAQQNPPSNNSFVAGVFVAKNYNYPGLRINSGGGAANTTYSISLNAGSIRLPDGRTIVPFTAGGTNSAGQASGGQFPATPIQVGAGTVMETVTPTAVSGCYIGAPNNSCTITAAFTYAHGQGEIVTSGSAGIQEAINDASGFGGGVVVVDPSDAATAGGSASLIADIAAAVVVPTVSVEYTGNGAPRYWSATPNGLAIAAATTLTAQAACDATHQFCSDAAAAGSASWGSTVYGCVTYVDIAGNESPCSATASFTSVTSMAIDIASPAAKTGAVGWIPYLSLSGGSYALAYQVPPTASVCTLSTLTPIPSCALKNTTYGSVASVYGADALFTGGAQIASYPVNTALTYPILATTAATITAQHPMTNSSVSYAYSPGSRVGACGISSTNMTQVSAAGGINGSSATTVPNPITSWTIPAGCFNYVGAEFRVTGKWTYTDGGDSSTHLYVSWDASGTNAASVPVPLCNVLDTATGTGAAYNGTWTCTVRILTTGATGTAMVNGYSTQNLAAGATTLVRNGADIAVAASGSINLTTNARISVWFEGIGATNNPGAQGLEASLEYIN